MQKGAIKRPFFNRIIPLVIVLASLFEKSNTKH
jgi:hypothetical protein